ncbi:MAG TPA: hypothetical protein DCE43_09535, partial [Planctomycetaceae bacterium]|nr:hypothetical protein [Planctomycetaceae bacterium]
MGTGRLEETGKLFRPAVIMSRCFLLWSLALLVRAPAVRADDIDDLAGRVDRLIEQRLLAETVTAAPVAGDAEFLRR